MQNLNEEDFKKKYLKYKAKYLELKDLLDGGTKKSTPSSSKIDCTDYEYSKDFSKCPKGCDRDGFQHRCLNK